MASKKSRKCQICKTLFIAKRRDAKTCSPACRKRLQRSLQAQIAEKAQRLESAVGREFHRLAADLLPKHAAYVPFVLADERGSIPVSVVEPPPEKTYRTADPPEPAAPNTSTATPLTAAPTRAAEPVTSSGTIAPAPRPLPAPEPASPPTPISVVSPPAGPSASSLEEHPDPVIPEPGTAVTPLAAASEPPVLANESLEAEPQPLVPVSASQASADESPAVPEASAAETPVPVATASNASAASAADVVSVPTPESTEPAAGQSVSANVETATAPKAIHLEDVMSTESLEPSAFSQQSVEQAEGSDEPPETPSRRVRFSPFRYNKLALAATGLALLLITVVGGSSVFLTARHNTDSAKKAKGPSSFAVTNLPLNGIKANQQLLAGDTNQLTINGQLRVNDTLVISPTGRPASPVTGQFYYDQSTNTPYYYNGTQFISLAPGVTSLGGSSGAIGLGSGLTMVNNQLNVSNSLIQQIGAAASSTGGVTSLQGQTGALTLGAGSGININGLTISNSGVTSLTGTPNQISVSSNTGNVTLSLPQDIATTSSPTFGGLTLNGNLVATGTAAIQGSGGLTLGVAGSTAGLLSLANGTNSNLSILQAAAPTGVGNANISLPSIAGGTSDTICLVALGNCGGSGGGVTTPGGTPGVIPVFTGAQTIADSILSQSGSTLTVAGNAIVNAANGFVGNLINLAVNGSSKLTVNQDGNITTGGTLTVNSSGASSVAGSLSIGTGLTVTSGGANITGTTNITGSGTITGALAIQGANALTLGTASTNTGAIVFNGSGGNGTLTLQGPTTPSVGNYTLSIPAINANANICTDNSICAGYAPSSGSGNYINNTTTPQTADFNITGSGTVGSLTVTSGGASITGNSTIAGTLTGLTGLTSSGTITFSGLNSAGVVHTNGSGVLSTGPVVLGTDTSGSYVANLGTLTGLTTTGNSGAGSTPTLSVTYGSLANTAVQGNTTLTVAAGTGLSGGGTITLGTGGTATLDVQYGSSAGTAVQGNTTLTCASGTGNLSGGGDVITLGTGGTCSNISITNSPTFTGTLAVQGSGGITVGVAGTTAGVLNLANATNSNLTVLQAAAPTGSGSATISLPSIAGGTSDTVCLVTLGNCAGSGGGITGSGTAGTLAVFTGTGSIGNSVITQSGSAVSVAGTLAVTGANSLTLGTASTNTGSLTFQNSSNANTLKLQAGATGGNLTFTLPTADGANGDCLQTNASGVLSFGSCTGGPGGGVTSLDGLTGILTLANSTGSGSTVTINNAAANGTTKGIATFNSTNFTDNGSGVINTIQDIATTSSPTFAGLTVNGDTLVKTTSTTAFRIQNGSSQNLLLADTTNSRVAVGPAAAAANSVLTVGTNTTAASGGITFGTDTNLYRAGANLLKTDDSFLSVLSTTSTSNSIVTGVASSISATPASNSSTDFIGGQFAIGAQSAHNFSTIEGVEGDAYNFTGTVSDGYGVYGFYQNSGGASVTTTNATGVHGEVSNQTNGTITTASALSALIRNVGTDINTGYGLLVQSATNGAGSFENNYGVYIQDQSAVGSTNSYNLYSAGATANNKIEGLLSLGVASSATGRIAFSNSAGGNTITLQGPAANPGGNYSLTIPTLTGNDTLCVQTMSNCTAVGSAGGDLTGSYPNPTIAKLQGTTLTLSSLASGDVLQYNGSAIVNGHITDSNLTAGTFSNITGVGALTAGSIGGSFGAISTGNNISTTAALHGNTLTVGSSNQFQVDASGNLTITNTAAIQGSNGLTLGNAGSVAGLLSFANATNSNLTVVQAAAPTGSGNASITIPAIAGGSSDTVCLVTLGNCAGSGGGIVGSGTAGTLAVFTGSGTIGNSILTQSGTTLTVGGNAIVNAANGFVGNLINLEVNSSSKLTVDQAGNTIQAGTLTVNGIGASSIAGSLSVSGDINTGGVYQIGGNTALEVNSGGTNIYVGGAGNGTNGADNFGAGSLALGSTSNDSFENVAVGNYSLGDNFDGWDNTAVGVGALSGNTDGGQNTALGAQAGATSVVGNKNTTGTGNTFIGYQAGPGTSTQLQNSTAIGISSVVSQSNSLVLGCVSGVNNCTANTKVGIDNATPSYTLDVAGDARFKNLSDSTTAFQIQNAAGTSNLLVADTTNTKLGVATAPSAGGATLQVGGTISLTTLGTADTSTVLCRNSSNIIATCAGTGAGSPFVQGGNSFGATAVLGTNDSNSLQIRTNGSTQATIAVGGATTFQNSADSTTAFQIQNQAGTSNLFIADTTNSRIGLGVTPITTSGSGLLQVGAASSTTAAQGISFGGDITANLYRTSAALLRTDGGLLVQNDLRVNGGNIVTSATTFNLLNNTVTTLNVGAAVGAGGIVLAGGSGSTGCTLDGSTGDFTCSGNITGASTGTVGYWSRSGTTLQPATAGDAITTSGNISTTGSGTITSAGLLTGSAGLTITGGTANINASGSGATNIGSTGSGGAVAIQSASTIALTSGTSLSLTSTGSNAINITPGGGTNTGVVVKPTADSTNAFQVQNSGAGADLVVDTTNNSITLQQAQSAAGGIPSSASLSTNASGGTLAAGTYKYKVAATNAYGTTVAITTNAGQVTTTGSTSQNTFGWAAASGATGYIVYRSTDAGVTWFTNSVSSGTLSIVDNGSTYTWSTPGTPLTTNSYGNLNVYGSSIFQPNAGASFLVQNPGAATIGIEVTTNTVGASCVLILATNCGTSINLAASTQIKGNSSGSLSVQGNAGQGINVDTSSNTNGVLTVNGTEVIKPTTDSVTAFQIQNHAATNNILTADTVNNRVQVDGTLTTMSAPGTLTLTAVAGGSLTASTTYFYKVTALDSAGGETTASAQNSVATTGVNKTINLSWTHVAGASGYRIYRGTSSNGETGYYTTINASYSDTGATQDNTTDTPPTTNTAYITSSSLSGSLQLSVGTAGTPTGQLYVSGTTPTAVSFSSQTFNTPFVATQGRYMYSVNHNGKFTVYDLSNPLYPVQIASVSPGGSLARIRVAGHYAYFVDNGNSIFYVYDISNPSSPTLSGSVALAAAPADIAVQGRYAYISELSSSSQSPVQVIDISNPASPSIIGSAANAAVTTAKAIAAQGNYVYVQSWSTSTLKIYNVANPASPTLVSSSSVGGYGIDVSGRYAYIGDRSATNFHIWDISNPASPVVVSDLAAPGGITSPLTSFVKVQGRYAYAIVQDVSGGQMYLETIDVSNPSNPAILSSVALTSAGSSNMSIEGRYAYIPGSSGLQVMDLGGAYVQQLEAGGIEATSIEIKSDANIYGNASIYGGLQAGGSIQTNGNLGVSGTAFFQGSTSFAGGILGGATINSLSTPSAPTVTPQGTTGATSYSYTITAVSASGGETVASSAGSTSTGNATLDTTNYNQITWSAVAGATSYKVYRTASGGTPSSTGLIGTTSSSLFNDTGLAGSGSSPANDTSGKFTNNGPALFKNTTNSTAGFQIQNSSGNEVFTADTTNGKVILGKASTVNGAIDFKSSSSANTVTLQAGATGATNPVFSLPTADGTTGQCLQTNGSGQFSFGACTTAGTTGTLQQVYDTGASVTTSSARDLAFTLADSATDSNFLVNIAASSTSKFAVQNAGADVLSVNASTIQIGNTTGAVTQTLNIGTNATGSSVTNLNMGSAIGTSPTSIQAGTSGITLSGAGGSTNTATLVKPLSDTTNAFNIQNAGATATLLNADTTNLVVTIAGTTSTFGNLTLTNAHFKSTQTTAPTVTTQPTAGNCGTVSGSNPTAVITAGSTDNAGSFYINSGSTTAGVCTTTITFNKTFGAAPKAVILSPNSTLGGSLPANGALQYPGRVTAITSTTFTVTLGTTNAANIRYGFYYWVIE